MLPHGNPIDSLGQDENEDPLPPVPPTEPSIIIDNENEYTASIQVMLSLAAANASEMYITNDSSCEQGGVWEPFAISKDWMLAQDNSIASVFVKYRSLELVESECIEDTIIHDNTLPPAVLSVDDGSIEVPGTITINWEEPQDTTDVGFYEVSLGTAEGLDDIAPWTKSDLNNSFSFPLIPLNKGVSYYGNVRAVDQTGNVGDSKSGDGFTSAELSKYSQNGNNHGCALFNNGSIKCFGRNNHGQLGYGNTNDLGDNTDEMGANLDFVDLGTGTTVLDVISGADHNCALLSDGKLKC